METRLFEERPVGPTVALLLESVLFLVVGLTWAVIAVTAATIVTRMAPAAIRGEALGTYAAVSAVAGGIGSLLGGALAEIQLPAGLHRRGRICAARGPAGVPAAYRYRRIGCSS